MSTRSPTRNLFPPLDNPEHTIQRKSRVDPTLLNDFEMAVEGNGDLPVPNLRTMEELCQPSLNGRGGPISPIAIQATNFGLKNDMLQQSIKVNGVTDDALRLYLFPYSLTHHVTSWFDRLLRNSINTFEQMAKIGTFMKRRPEECYDLIENMTAHHNDWDTSAQRSESSSSVTSSSDTEIAALKAEMAKINKNLMRVLQPLLARPRTYMLQKPTKEIPTNLKATIHQPRVVTTNEFTNFKKENDAILKNMQTNVTSLTNSNRVPKNMFAQFMKMNTASSSGSRTLPGNTITNPKEELKGITTRSGTAYQGPTIPTTSSSLPLVVERETEATKDMVYPTNNGSTKDVQPPVVQTESSILNSEPVVALIIEPVVTPVSALKPNQRPSIQYPSRLHDQKLCDKANDQREKFFQIFKDLNFNISFADALILMPKFGPTIKTLLTNKDKLSELARTPLNEYCSAVLLKKINLMPLSVWNKLSLPDLSPTCMSLELSDRLIFCPIGVAEDVFIKVGTFHFPDDFVVIDFNADPRVPLILKRSFLKTERALIDVFEGELTLRVGKEAITFNLDKTSRYSANYNDMTANQIDVIDTACWSIRKKFLVCLCDRDDKLPVIIAKDLSVEEKTALITVLKSHKRATALKLSDIKGIDPEFCTHKILIEYDFEPAVQRQRRVNLKIHDVIKNEVLKLLDAGLIYPISDSLWRLAGNEYYCFLDGFLCYFQIPIDPKDQEKTTFTCLYGTFAYRRMPFGLCNALGTFQRQKMLKRCEDTNLCLNWDKSHFTIKEGIILGHKISKNRIEVDKAKVDVIAKLPHPTTVKGICSFLGHAVFYRRFIKDFSKIAQLMTRLLEKDTLFFFSKECVEAFQTLKRKLTKAPILITPDWDLPFELMCDASDFAIGEVLGFQAEIAPLGSTPSRVHIQMGENRASCSDKLDDALWAFRTAYKTPIECTPYKLVYKKACHIPIELEHKAYWALKHANFDLQTAGDHRKV
nr:reverse transcriptase domain-containing protein [Tanacetum cinerariifolium]